jgi:MFS family permease
MSENTSGNGRYYMIVAAACLLMVVGAAGSSGLSFFIAPVTAEFGFSRSAFTLYMSIVTFSALYALPVIGKLIPKIGVRNLVLIHGIVCTLGFAGFSFANSLPMFYFCSAVIGTVFHTCTISAVVLINTWFIEKRGTMIGLAMAFTGVGGFALSAIMPNFIAENGWHVSYLLLAGIVFLCTIPSALFLIKNTPQSVGLKPFGYKEVDASVAASDAEDLGVPYARALKSLAFYALYLAFLMLGALSAGASQFPAFLSGQGFGPAEVSGLMMVFMIAMTAAKILLGILDDKIGTFANLIVSYGATIIGVFLLTRSAQYVMIGLGFVCFSLGFATLSVYTALITSRTFGQRDYAGIYGVVATAMSVGNATGAPLWAMAFDKTGSYNIAFYACGVAVVLVFLLFIYALKSGAELRKECKNIPNPKLPMN